MKRDDREGAARTSRSAEGAEVPAARAAGGASKRVRSATGATRSEVDAPVRAAAAKPVWLKQMAQSITSADGLAQVFDLTPDELEGARRAEREGFPIRVTRYYAALADKRDPSCPIRKQCVPSASEAVSTLGDLVDPLGEVAHEVAPHLVQRYPDRALLLVTDRCAVYCRFCTRSRMVGDGGGAIPISKLEPAFDYLRRTPGVRDVIVSGGDPLGMTTARLVRVIERLRDIPSLDTIRLATRMPVTLPSRITAELVRALKPHHPLWLMTHFNHPKELSPAALRALARLADAGFPIMNQTVLLRGINDDPAILEQLFRGLIRARAKPYYLLQMDPVVGTGHLRTRIADGLGIMEALHGRLTGIALPKYIVDTPGGLGKVPMSPRYVVAETPGKTRLRTFRGAEVDYIDPR